VDWFTARGTCIGVYGGPKFGGPYLRSINYIPNDYLVSVHHVHPRRDEILSDYDMLDGDTIMAILNTLFDDRSGEPYAQASSGYSVDAASFKVGFEDGSFRLLTAFFALEDLYPVWNGGTDLRWNYGYSKANIENMRTAHAA